MRTIRTTGHDVRGKRTSKNLERGSRTKMIEAGKDYLFIDGDNDISAERIAPGPHMDVGAELRASREARNLDIDAVAQDLRIRESYLHALEAGAYDDLPGIPYAIGFVRSYATYLRVDAKEMVRRFKAEVGVEPERENLSVLEPVRYGRMPVVVLAAVAVIAAGALYGVWHFYNSGEEDTLAARARATGDAVATTTPPPAPKAGARVAGTSGGKGETATGRTLEARHAGLAKKSPDGTKGTGTVPSTGTSAGASAALTGPDGTATPDGAIAKDPTIGQSGTTSGAPKRAAGDTATRQVAAVPRDETVRLKARANAWVQIKDKDNRVVFVKVLRAGDSYAVPKRVGLIMNVGNAGGLEIMVGDVAIKSLGPDNMPVFNVSLDPKALLEHRR